MSFEAYLSRERELYRKKNLFEKFSDPVYRQKLTLKFFDGRSLAERTSLGAAINFENRCSGEFSTTAAENVYCSLGSFSGRNISCKYLSEHRDHNGLRPCLNPTVNSLKKIIQLTEEETRGLVREMESSTKH